MGKLKVFMVIGIATLVAISFGICGGAQGESVDWHQFAGEHEKILIAGCERVSFRALLDLIPEFEQKTGIKVTMEMIAEEELFTKRLLDATSGHGVYDVVWLDHTVQFARAGWTEPLEPYLNDPSLFDLDLYDMEDFVPTLKNWGLIDGKLTALPVGDAGVDILFYRKDLFEEKGLAPPGWDYTYDRLYEDAVALHNPPEYAGIVARVKRIYPLQWSSPIIWSYGARWFDCLEHPRRTVINSVDGQMAVSYIAKLVQDAAFEECAGYGPFEAASDFEQAKAAMFLDISIFMPWFEDPKKSKVSGKVGYALTPLGPRGRFANIWACMFGMTSYSKHKRATALFLYWATGPEITRRIALRAGGVARKSSWRDPDVMKQFPKDWVESCLTMMDYGGPEAPWPKISQFDSFLDIIGGGYQAVILGEKTAKESLDEAARLMDEVLQQE